MKKLLLAAIIAVFCIFNLYAYDVEINGIYYNLDTKNLTATVTSGDIAYSGFVSIPAKIQHNISIYSVTEIGSSAFRDNTELTSISIPKHITKIQKWAFNGCKNLKNVYISDLTAWCNIIFDSYPFYDSETGDFYLNDKKLINLIIPDNVITINDNAFRYCSSIESLTIPNNVVTIGGYAFQYCSSLQTLIIGNGLRNMGSYCFSDCTSLNSVFLSEGISKIGYCSFMSCTSLKTINIPNTINIIDQGAFSCCESLKSINIPNNIKEIASCTFYRCTSLESVTLGNGLAKINSEAFKLCSAIKSVYITNLESWCKVKCGDQVSGNTDRNPIASGGADLYLNGEKIINLIIPEGIDSIENSVFQKCSSIKTLTLPSTIKHIGSYAFNSCPSLHTIEIKAITPPKWNNGMLSKYPIIYIPKGTKTAYQEAWGTTMPFIDQEIELTLNIPIPGGLKDAILDAGIQPNLVTKLILSGELNNDDFKLMREDMTSLYSINLKNIKNKNLCTGLSNKNTLIEIILPDSISHINGLNTTNIQTIIIPENAISIEDNAFEECKFLTSISIPDSLCHIGEYAFNKCSNLEIINTYKVKNFTYNYTEKKEIETRAFGNCNKLRTITIPKAIKSIGSPSYGGEVFYNCYSLQNIILSANIEKIHYQTFQNCTNLDTIISYAITPPSIVPREYNFTSINTNECVLKVRTEAKNDYAEHNIWGQFFNIENIDIKKLTITISINNNAMGMVIGGGEYEEDSEITLTATPNEGYHFVQWSDGVTDATRTIIVTDNVNLSAEFAINIYTVTLNAENGVITGAGEYEHGTEVILTATPAEGYHFVQWSDGVTEATRTITVTDNITLSAEFDINVYPVAVSAENGVVTGAGEYEHGTEVILTATPNDGYEFVQWSDGVTDATRIIIVTEDIELVAEFRAISIGTDINDTQTQKMRIYTKKQTLYVEGIENEYYVFNATGKVIYYGKSPMITLPCGVYIVASDSGEYQKVIIK